jgi:exosome complex RNA-binding protein Rrp4
MQNDITQLMNEEQQILAQITDLDRQKDALIKTKDDELARLDSAISRLQGQ